jgi:DNA-binding SARP family transcriptional activator
LIRIHIIEGNSSEAIRHYERYRSLIRRELNIEPSRGLQELVALNGIQPSGET